MSVEAPASLSAELLAELLFGLSSGSLESAHLVFGECAVFRRLLVLVSLVAIGWQVYAYPPGTDDEIRERLAPIGSICRAGDDCASAVASTSTSSGPMSGQEVYDTFCFACHLVGVSDAPKLGDLADWEPRLAQGLDTLWDHTKNGIGLMPAGGSCVSCDDDELRAAMDYMVDSVQ